ncbi:hypothetical protein ABW365_22355 [Enterococcus avium]|jgi:ABC-2 type transport system permease protein
MRNSYEGLILTGGIIVILVLINLFDKLKYYNPISLVTQNLNFLQGTVDIQKYLPAILISILFFALATLLSIQIFNKKKL